MYKYEVALYNYAFALFLKDLLQFLSADILFLNGMGYGIG